MRSYLGAKALLFITITFLKVASSVPASGKVKALYNWSPFEFSGLPQSEFAQVDGYNYYISKFILPTAASLHIKSQCMFFPILRLNPGIPATVTYVDTSEYRKGSSPVLRGFPTYEDNYVPGWFGVNTLPDDDYLHNIYPGYGKNLNVDDEEDIAEKDESKKDDQFKDESKKDEEIKEEIKKDDQVTDESRKEEVKDKKVVEEKLNVKEAVKREEDEIIDEKRKVVVKTDKEEVHDESRKSHGSYNKNPSVVYVPVQTPSVASSRNLYHFVSVYYTNMDNQCNRLFFVDYGVQRQFGNVIYTRRPVLWAFPIYGCTPETLNQPPVLKVTIPNTVYNDATGFSTAVIDIYGSCDEFAVYIANCYDNSIVVYDNVKKSFWAYKHNTFQPGAERSFVSGLPPLDSYNFGVMGISLGAQTKSLYKDFYYAPGSSYGVFKSSTEIIRNKYWAPGDPASPFFAFLGYGGIDRQLIMLFDDETQVLFFIHLLSNTLQCWNTLAPLEDGNVVTLFSDLEFGVDMLLDGDRNLRFLLYNGNGLTFYDQGRTTNPFYQLYYVNIDSVIKGTACDPKYV